MIPFIGFLAAIILLWGVAFNWAYLVMFLIMYCLTGVGVTVGYHRLFTHRSFKTSKPVTFVLGVLGSMAVQGPVINWVADHRKHHQFSDREADPHSPHHHGDSALGVLRGAFHAHMGWLFTSKSGGTMKYARDLCKDPLVRMISRLFPLWVLIGMIVPAAIGGLITGTWMGVLLGFIWGGLVRIFLVHHLTWSVNSICHIWGARPYNSHDHSRNNLIFGILGFGEGWHNNHHAFPTSARHGLRWWEIDVSYIIIRTMGLLGLAHDIRVPNKQRMMSKSSFDAPDE